MERSGSSLSIFAFQPSDDVYLIAVDDQRGQVFELAVGKTFPPRSIEEIMSRGYWAEPDLDDKTTEQVLDAFRKAKGAVLT
jgi:hypothetical protein